MGLLLTDGDTLVGYTWTSFECCRGVSVRPLFHLTDHQAYLYDLYVTEGYRSRGLAGLMRRNTYAELRRMGRTELFSISEYLNKPARRFKAKLAAERLELRLGLTILRRWRLDVRLRRYRRPLPTRWGIFSNQPNPVHLI